MESHLAYFSSLMDPCVERTHEHRLDDILFIAIASIICGAESWNDMEEFDNAKRQWLKSFLQLPNGIPSHDTFIHVFSALNLEELEKCFMECTRSIAGLCVHEVIAIDGRSMSGGREADNKHLLNAWAGQNHIVLRQVKADEKSNEITAIPCLLE